MTMLNAGTVRVTIAMGDRAITGLHVCGNCATIVRRAWAPQDRAQRTAVLVSASGWQGPCDLCRYTATLVAMLGEHGETRDGPEAP